MICEKINKKKFLSQKKVKILSQMTKTIKIIINLLRLKMKKNKIAFKKVLNSLFNNNKTTQIPIINI
jgi:hypothetical protein